VLRNPRNRERSPTSPQGRSKMGEALVTKGPATARRSRAANATADLRGQSAAGGHAGTLAELIWDASCTDTAAGHAQRRVDAVDEAVVAKLTKARHGEHHRVRVEPADPPASERAPSRRPRAGWCWWSGSCCFPRRRLQLPMRTSNPNPNHEHEPRTPNPDRHHPPAEVHKP